jgi:hypothetical protein
MNGDQNDYVIVTCSEILCSIRSCCYASWKDIYFEADEVCQTIDLI